MYLLREKELLTWDEVVEAFADCHAIAGDRIETLEDWETFVTPVVGENQVYYEDTEEEGGEAYDFGKCPIYADPDIFYVEQVGDMFYITDGIGGYYR